MYLIFKSRFLYQKELYYLASALALALKKRTASFPSAVVYSLRLSLSNSSKCLDTFYVPASQEFVLLADS